MLRANYSFIPFDAVQTKPLIACQPEQLQGLGSEQDGCIGQSHSVAWGQGHCSVQKSETLLKIEKKLT